MSLGVAPMDMFQDKGDQQRYGSGRVDGGNGSMAQLAGLWQLWQLAGSGGMVTGGRGGNLL